MLAHSDIVCHNERQHGCDCRDLHHHPGRRRVHVHWLLALLLLSVAAARGAAAVLPLKQRIGNSDVLGLGPLPPVPTPVALSALSCRRLLALYQHGPTAATPSTTTASKSETHPAAGHEPTDGTTTSNRVGAVPEQPQGLLRELPAALVPEFTLDGRLPLEHYLVDDTHGGQGSHFRFPGAHVARLVARASEQLSAAHAAAEAIAAYPSETETHPSEAATETKSDEAGEATAATVSSLSSVPTTLPSNLSTIAAEVAALAASAESLRGLRVQDRWYVALLALLTDAAVAGRHALVFGTTEPWYEALLLAAGASSVTTVEYNELTIGTFVPRAGGYDLAISASSFDHDGLGRYGDPLDANADLRAMRLARCLVRPGGLLLLTVPIGPDVVVYNLHRRYGRTRLPLMLQGWTVEAGVGWNTAKLDTPANFRQSYEPVLVLRQPDPERKPTARPSVRDAAEL